MAEKHGIEEVQFSNLDFTAVVVLTENLSEFVGLTELPLETG